MKTNTMPNAMNPSSSPLLTDLYQLTMSRAYFATNRHQLAATFDYFFRKAPFNGTYAVLAGINAVTEFIASFQFSASDAAFVKKALNLKAEDPFLEWLRGVDASGVTISAVPEGTVIRARVPLMRLDGPLAVLQLLETTVLNKLNFATLVATCTARLRVAVGWRRSLVEFGCRRAQGADGALSASRYAYLGGADGTSNVLAGQQFGVPLVGTHAHAYVTAHSNDVSKECADVELYEAAVSARSELGLDPSTANTAELIAFVNYAVTFKNTVVILVDTYDTLNSGVPNAIALSVALYRERGARVLGVRLDSGDLAALSVSTRAALRTAVDQLGRPEYSWLESLKIIASNDLDEAKIRAMNGKHEIDVFGVGTNLATCAAQPSLGGVYKLSALGNKPCMKLSENLSKTTLPGRKCVVRLYDQRGTFIADVVSLLDNQSDEGSIRKEHGETVRILPFKYASETNDVDDIVWERVNPAWSESLLRPLLRDGTLVDGALSTIDEARTRVMSQLRTICADVDNEDGGADVDAMADRMVVGVSEQLRALTQSVVTSLSRQG